jgi:hypothetical protein
MKAKEFFTVGYCTSVVAVCVESVWETYKTPEIDVIVKFVDSIYWCCAIV